MHFSSSLILAAASIGVHVVRGEVGVFNIEASQNEGGQWLYDPVLFLNSDMCNSDPDPAKMPVPVDTPNRRAWAYLQDTVPSSPMSMWFPSVPGGKTPPEAPWSLSTQGVVTKKFKKGLCKAEDADNIPALIEPWGTPI